MQRLTRLRPSPAMAVACIALAVSLGGTSYAVLKLPKNSVGSKQLKRNAVTGKKVKSRSLTADDFKEGELPAGSQGPQGPAGATGPAGSAMAYAHVLANGTLDSAYSYNVTSVTRTDFGSYCLTVNGTPKNISATAFSAPNSPASGTVSPSSIPGPCPAGTDAFVSTGEPGVADREFSVTFN